MDEAVLKNTVEDTVKAYSVFLDENKMKLAVYKLIQEQYMQGLDSAEIRFNMNFVPDHAAINFLQRFGFQNVKDLTVELQNALRKEMTMGLMNKENITDLTVRIQKVMQVGVERAKLIAVTETNRAFNQAHFQAAKDSRLDVKKQWNAQPERDKDNPCPYCEELDGQIVGMNESFTNSKGNYFLPPAHPRCKCRVIYVQK